MLTGRRCAVCACAISLMFLHTGTRCELCSFVACSHCSHQVRPGQCSDLVSGLKLLVSPPSAPPSEFELQHGSAGDESYVGFGLLINGRHLADQVTLPIFNRNEYSLPDIIVLAPNAAMQHIPGSTPEEVGRGLLLFISVLSVLTFESGKKGS